MKTLSIWVIHNSFFKILLIVCSWNNFWNHQNCCFLLLLFSIWFAHLITIGLLLFAFLYWHKFCAESKISQVTFHKREKIMNQYLFCLKIVVEFSRKNEIDEVYLFYFIAFRWLCAALLNIIECFYFMNLKQPETKRKMILLQKYFRKLFCTWRCFIILYSIFFHFVAFEQFKELRA